MKKTALSLAAALVFSGSGAMAQEDGETMLTVYAWGTDVYQRLNNGQSVETDSSDIIDNLDFAFMGEVVHRRGPWLFGFEGFYADVDAGETSTLPVEPGEPGDPDSVDVFAGVNTVTYFAYGFAGYELVRTDNYSLYGTAGLRYTNFDTDVNVEANGNSFDFNTTDELWDAVVGVRGNAQLTDRWSIPFVIDVGTGSSDLTYQLFGGISYGVGRSNFTLGYRQMVWDIGGGADAINKVDYSGPVIAYSYTF